MTALRLRVPVSPESVSRIGDWLDGEALRLGLGDEVRDALRVCAEEAATNIVLHAFPDGGGGTFHVELEANGEVRLAFEDAGIPFDPTGHAPAPTPASPDEAQIGGLGIRLMRGFARALRYERAGGVNRLVMFFPRGAPAG